VGASTDGPGLRVSRRGFLATGATAGAAVVAGAGPAGAQSSDAYPRLRVIGLSVLRVNDAVEFAYPLRGQPNWLVDLGAPVPKGVGPNRSIVAYSALCQHMGCPVNYERGTREFVCPCHQSRYDAERLASIVTGVATRALPRVLLEATADAVFAVGIEGLVYGYRSNLAPGRKVEA
jgi:arsenite oxidase small subunit